MQLGESVSTHWEMYSLLLHYKAYKTRQCIIINRLLFQGQYHLRVTLHKLCYNYLYSKLIGLLPQGQHLFLPISFNENLVVNINLPQLHPPVALRSCVGATYIIHQ